MRCGVGCSSILHCYGCGVSQQLQFWLDPLDQEPPYVWPEKWGRKKNNTTQVSSCHSPGQDLPMFSYISHVKSQGQGPLRSDPSPLMLTRFPSSLSLKHAKLPSTPGLLHLLFLLPGMLFPCIHMAHSLTACWSPLKCHLDTEACPSHPSHSPPL